MLAMRGRQQDRRVSLIAIYTPSHISFLSFWYKVNWGREDAVLALFTFPSRRVYSSRTSCSRSVTAGWEGRRRGFSELDSEVGTGRLLLLLLSEEPKSDMVVVEVEGLLLGILLLPAFWSGEAGVCGDCAC